MKRFQSPFQKIQRLQQQQLRIAEFHLARAQAALRNADQQIRQLQDHCASAEQDFVNQLTGAAGKLRPEFIHAARADIEQCRSDLRIRTELREELRTATEKATTAWRELNARCDGVDNLTRNKMAEHRRESVQSEQTELDESARAINLLNQRRSRRDSLGAATDGETLR